ncbi:hypothetical protein K435DRAFT_15507 [Dendrothele bispora CBS 962.96]|uniref:P-loop containing nucleoside triphosphate hydrolase protein n=1 Tax=Dendrothele bispora (strain CBS 962.96) TaxID=1314807 RepID=A0A4S8MZD1_DENBC|nr:hypothetical protein K435DRAFT_15507 [Dendrothele bispora CBS 962.96]
MAESKKSSSSRNVKGKPKLNQRTLLDMFPKKQSNMTAEKQAISSEKASSLDGEHSKGLEQSAQEVMREECEREMVGLAASESSGNGSESKLSFIETSTSVGTLADLVVQDIGSTNTPSSPVSIPDFISITDTPSSPASDLLPEVINVEDDTSSQMSGPPTTSSPIVLELDDTGVCNDPEPTGSHKDDPIILTDSPAKPFTRSVSSKVAKPTYSIFAPRLNKSHSLPVPLSKPPPSPSKTPRSIDAPFPDKFSQHVRGPQTNSVVPSSSFPTRQKHSDKDVSGYVNLSLESITLSESFDSCSAAPTCRFEVEKSTSQNAHPVDIPVEHLQSHPVIAQLVESSLSLNEEPNSSSHKLWTDKWHPTRAEHVLGNEQQALYLRDWLWTLQVHLQETSTQASQSGKGKTQRKKTADKKRGSKRPRVVRAVDKKRRRINSDDEDDDSWIVYSDAIEYDDYNDEEESHVNKKPRLTRQISEDSYDSLLNNSTSSHWGQVPVRHTFKDGLTNTILLTGGHGVGKTAAVYACAEELDWEVFEVYPGIGKRNGANLDSLVGEVGKNHLVQGKGGVGSLKAMLLGKSKGLLEDCQSLSVDFDEVEDSKITVAQSCILLEEVDILYKEDVNFWPSVINIIKECRRPVILTCNDPSLIPVEDLPLQTILNFEPCPPPVAVSYLQAICCAQGYTVKREAMSQLHDGMGLGEESEMLSRDLRRSIHCLQLWCPMQDGTISRSVHDIPLAKAVNPRVTGTETSLLLPSVSSSDQHQPQRDFQEARVNQAELMSFADCCLLRNRMDTVEVSTEFRALRDRRN